MSPSDEELGAYLDGELDAPARAQIETAIAAQPGLAERVERMRQVRTRLGSAFDPTLQEPTPQRLLEPLGLSSQGAGVADFSSARAARANRLRRGWSWAEWGAIAASVMLGVLVGFTLFRDSSDGLVKMQDDELLADGELADALSTRLVSAQSPDGDVHVVFSFATQSGDYCRTFALRGGQDLAGVACRRAGAWHVQVLARNDHGPEGPDGAQQAGSALPPAVVLAVTNEIDGEPLDAAGEAAARSKNWSTR